jgi:hypothetical protein
MEKEEKETAEFEAQQKGTKVPPPSFLPPFTFKNKCTYI